MKGIQQNILQMKMNVAAILDLFDAEDSETPDSSSPVHYEDTMSAYLDDIKNTAPLSREREVALAKTLHEAESLKRVYTGEWLLLFAELIDWRKIKKNQTRRFQTARSCASGSHPDAANHPRPHTSGKRFA